MVSDEMQDKLKQVSALAKMAADATWNLNLEDRFPGEFADGIHLALTNITQNLEFISLQLKWKKPEDGSRKETGELASGVSDILGGDGSQPDDPSVDSVRNDSRGSPT